MDHPRSAFGASPSRGRRQRTGEAGSAAAAWWRAAVGGVVLATAAGASAQMFPDNEARRAIVELRERLARSEEQLNAQIAAQNQALEPLRRSLLDLNAQIESLRGELARLRGQNEQLTRDVAELQRRQKDIAQGVDERMRKLEPQKVTLDGKEFLVDTEEKRQYEEALALLRSGDFTGAANSLAAFARRWPASGYIDSARFWLGNALYGKRDYKEAIIAFRALLTANPEHPRAPEALLAVANCQIEMKDLRAARATLADLIRVYPRSEAAQAGRDRLAALK
jgi:tol-pal system protein YbgF